jgi:predicted nucleotidyltransferase
MSGATTAEAAERMVCADEIRVLADKIAAEFRPERIILFGSQAVGTATEDSDVDLLVIMPFEGRALRASVEIACRVKPSFPVDILARRPDDTARRYALGDPLVREALDDGIVLYERDR